MKSPNLYGNIPEMMRDEFFETLLETRQFRLERIVSRGHATPAGVWYDQATDEWVALLKGGAGLLFEGEAEARVLGPGDCLHIPSHRRHRVEWTDPNGETVWLALHYQESTDNNDEAGL